MKYSINFDAIDMDHGVECDLYMMRKSELANLRADLEKAPTPETADLLLLVIEEQERRPKGISLAWI